MHFVVHAIDKPDALERRQAIIDAHRAYTRDGPGKHGVKLLISGPLLKEDGETMGGSFFLLEAPDRRAVDALIANDPISSADVWDSVTISPFYLRQNNMSPTQ